MAQVVLPLHYYQSAELLPTAQNLLGKYLCTHMGNDEITTGMIVETEAYSASERASHAYKGRTKRTEIMFGPGGHAYVYLCYGIHYLFNIVLGHEGSAECVLIRAIQPVDGIGTMLQRRNAAKLLPAIAAGPGKVCSTLAIGKHHNGELLTGNAIWLEDRGIVVAANDIIASPRVGVDYAGEHAKLPWRFRIHNNAYTSPPR